MSASGPRSSAGAPGSRHPRIGAWSALIAASAWFGAVGLAFDLLGFPQRLTERLPFHRATVGGAALAVVIAIPYSVLTVLAWRGDRRTLRASFTCGILMIGWITVEMLIVREFSFLQPVLLVAGTAFAVAGSEATRRPRRRRRSGRMNRKPRSSGRAI